MARASLNVASTVKASAARYGGWHWQLQYQCLWQWCNVKGNVNQGKRPEIFDLGCSFFDNPGELMFPSDFEEMDKMWEEHDDQTRQAEEAAKETNDGGDFPLMGEKQYDLSGTTSYEYDVIECEDFVEEKDMWVNNMPEEIRIANPDFVPT